MTGRVLSKHDGPSASGAVSASLEALVASNPALVGGLGHPASPSSFADRVILRHAAFISESQVSRQLSTSPSYNPAGLLSGFFASTAPSLIAGFPPFYSPSCRSLRDPDRSLTSFFGFFELPFCITYCLISPQN